MGIKIRINGREISAGSRAYIIAEAGVNYYELAKKFNLSLLDAAKLMVESAASAGADAIKFQTYKAGTIASKNSPAYWNAQITQRQYFTQYDKFDRKEYRELAIYAKEKGILFLSTPFDNKSADFLNELMPLYKISSSDINNIPFLRYIAKKNKPIILSTGASNLGEIETAIECIETYNKHPLVLLHCILCYPTDYLDANLARISYLKKVFPHQLFGYSDHTLPDAAMLVNAVAAAFGACVIEKHFTLDKTIPGNDHYHAMDVEDLRKLKNNLDLLHKIIGKETGFPIPSELKSRIYARRSLVACSRIAKGTLIIKDLLTAKRPGTGISPAFIDNVVGMKAARSINEDEQITWSKIK